MCNMAGSPRHSLSARSQAHKAAFIDILEKAKQKDREEMSDFQGLGQGREGLTTKGTGEFGRVTELFCILTVVAVTQLSTSAKTHTNKGEFY